MKTLLQDTIREFGRAQPAELAGAISYFAILSAAPILVVVVSVAALLFGPDQAETAITRQLDVLIGEQVTEQLEVLFADRVAVQSRGLGIIGVGTLLIGATGLFAQIQRSLNRIWRVRPKPKRSLLAIIRGRGVGFLIALLLGALFALLILVDGAVVAVGASLRQQFNLPGTALAVSVAETLLSFGLLSVLFAVMFRILPDAISKWRDVWVGAAFTALLFSLGQGLFGLYLREGPALTSVAGAAGSIILLLLWVYVSAFAFLFGAQFTRVFARRYGERIQPKPYAVRLPAVDELVDQKTEQSSAPQGAYEA